MKLKKKRTNKLKKNIFVASLTGFLFFLKKIITRQKKRRTMSEEICFVISQSSFLAFVAQMMQCGIDVVACNTTSDKKDAYVWIVNSLLLKTQLIETMNGMNCGGHDVTIIQKKKGKLIKTLRNKSYFDLLKFVNDSQASAWSPPTCLDVVKKVYRNY